MKTKIKKMAELRAYKQQVDQSVDQLEGDIHAKWSELKRSLKNGKDLNELFREERENDKKQNATAADLFSNSIRVGIDSFVEKIIDRASRKLNKFFSRKKK